MSQSITDSDGENRAVRMFLAVYGTPGLTVGSMKLHMKRCGHPFWPDWVESTHADTHLTKAGAQLWIRHLFELEQQKQQTCNCRWDGEKQAQQCTLHAAHVEAIHEWAERAKAAEAKLKSAEARSTIVALQRERDGFQQEAEWLQKRLRFAHADLDLLRSHQENNCWYWQGDGYDYLDSMANDMVVVIHAADLRAMLTTQSAAPVQEPPDDELTQALIERDETEAIADELAQAIAQITGVDIGEHTSANCPWRSALDAAEDFLCHPPAAQRPWVGLTDGQREQWLVDRLKPGSGWAIHHILRDYDEMLREKNRGAA